MTGIWSIDDWAAAATTLPVSGGPLACRVVVVPNARVAHALRARLLERGEASTLPGALFANAATLATEVLARAAVDCRPGEESLRAARLARIFAAPPALQYFDAELLRTTPGWEEAFAQTIADVEGAGLSPEQLELHGGAAADVGALWKLLSAQAQSSWSVARILSEATVVIARRPDAFDLGAATLAVVTGHEPAVTARFLRAIPNVRLMPAVVRPMRHGHLERVERLYGKDVREALAAPASGAAGGTERDRLAAHLFGPPGARRKGKAAGPSVRDGTADLEEHAGLEAELEAAVDWVAAEVFEHGVELRRIAVLVPHPDPYLDLLVERLDRLPWPEPRDDAPPAFVADGLRAVAHADGARLRQLLRTMRDYLGIDSLRELLPSLRLEDDGRMPRGAAFEVLQTLGCVGGSPANPRGALRWPERLAARTTALGQRLEADSANGDDVRVLRGRSHLKRLLERMRGLQPALAALCELVGQVIADAPLSALWPALQAFASDHMRFTQGERVLSLLKSAVAPLCADAAVGTAAGDDALACIEGVLERLRIGLGHYGEARVYVGTVTGAQGLPFESVRVLGLAEGQLPTSPREDAVLPDSIRRAIDPNLRTNEERVRAQLHAFDRVVRGAARRVVLSAPRMGLGRSVREPSALFIEAAVAIGRSPGVPDRAELEQVYFAPARAAQQALRRRAPLLGTARLERAALRDPAHAESGASPAVSTAATRLLLDPARPGPLDGLLGTELAPALLPGLSPERPATATALQTLMTCPYRFLLERVLGFDEPYAVRSRSELDPREYGTLMHRVAERFAQEHGVAFGTRHHDLEHFQARGAEIARAELSALLEELPLESAACAAHEESRLLRDFRAFLTHDWDRGRARTLVAAERSFGWEAPLSLSAGGKPFYMRGQIDRLDVQDGVTLLRDLKSGKPKHRQPGDAPDHIDDLQLGVYALVTEHLATEWKVPARLRAAYVYPRGSRNPERAFEDADLEQLRHQSRAWLDLAAGLLRAGALPRTPTADNCKYCAFKPVCGPRANVRAQEVIAQEPGTLTDFGDLKENA